MTSVVDEIFKQIDFTQYSELSNFKGYLKLEKIFLCNQLPFSEYMKGNHLTGKKRLGKMTKGDF